MREVYMRISSVFINRGYFVNNQVKKKQVNLSDKAKNMQPVSFKRIYKSADVSLLRNDELSLEEENQIPTRDGYLLNELASLYPNQDCFIMSGSGGYPCLFFREVPPVVQVFNSQEKNKLSFELKLNDEQYPFVPLILYPDNPKYCDKRPEMNAIIGCPPKYSTNPSYIYTIQVAYEVHKKLMEKKYQILNALGKNEHYDFGTDETIMDKAHKEIEDVENAATRYLLECALISTDDKIIKNTEYEDSFSKIKEKLDLKRIADLTTSIAEQPMIDTSKRVNLCKMITELYPNTDENKQRIQEIVDMLVAINPKDEE